MLDYNTLNNLVEIFKKQGVRGVTLENGSTLEIKDGALLVNGKFVGGVKVIDTDNITALSTETIEGLSAGDIVVKHTGEETHTYIVTYKEEHHGICISYFAAGYSETVSYDYVTDAWVYNSTDIVTPKEYTGGSGISIDENGVISNTAQGKKLYRYNIEMSGDVRGDITIISGENITPTSGEQLYHFIRQLFPTITGANKNFGCASCVCRHQGTDPDYFLVPLNILYASNNECLLIGHYYPSYSGSPVEKSVNISSYGYNTAWFLQKQEI